MVLERTALKERLLGIIICIIMYLSNGLWSIEVLSGYIQLVLVTILTGIAVFLGSHRINKRMLMILFVMLGSTAVSEIFGTNVIQLMIEIDFLICAFLISQCISFKKFFDTYTDFMYVLSIAAIAGFLAKLLLPGFLQSLPLPIIERPFSTVYGNQFFYNAFIVDIPINYNRVVGIYSEPGVFVVYIIIAFLYEAFVRTESSVKHQLVFCGCILLTFSATAYVCLLMLVLVYVLPINNPKIRRSGTILILALMLGVIAVNIWDPALITRNVTNKFSTTNISLTDRTDAIISACKMMMDYPFVGCGSGKKVTYGSIQTFTPLNWFAVRGFIYGIICCYGLMKYQIFFKVKLSRLGGMLAIFALVIGICAQAFEKDLVLFTVIFYSISKSIQNRGVQGET